MRSVTERRQPFGSTHRTHNPHTQERYQSAFLRKQDENGSWWFCFIGTARWFGFRLDMLSALFLLAAAVVVVPLRQYVSVSLVGISLAHVLQLSGLLQWFMRQTAEVENNMTR